MGLQRLNGLAAFLFFSLSLCLPSGYSYGAVIFMFAAILSLNKIKKIRVDKFTVAMCFIIFLMGVLWSHTFSGLFLWTGSDQWLKYSISVLCLMAVLLHGVNPVWIQWGVTWGAGGALFIAIYQYLVLGVSKATGYTNAIQYGGLAMYLGMAAWSFAIFGGQKKSVKLVFWIGGSCGILASLLSGTRGAWVVAPILLFFIFLWLWNFGYKKITGRICIFISFVIAVMVIPYGEKLYSRSNLAEIEFQQYMNDPQKAAETSIGQRLEQWNLAWSMWKEKPLLGWGTKGVVQRKQEYVDQGRAHPSVMDYGHAHNEVLDMLAKRGILGLLFLFLFYAIPLAAFWPSQRRIVKLPVAQQGQALALRGAAALLPIAYFGFGWTQVFFAHNSGNMFYLFAIVAFWGALQYLERTDAVEA